MAKLCAHFENDMFYNGKEVIRKNQETMETTPAVDKTIADMPDEFEIKGFLREHQSEVKNMCITEYDEAETMEMFKEEGREEGIKQGIRNASVQIAQNFLRKGDDAETVSECTGLPLEEVRALKAELLQKV